MQIEIPEATLARLADIQSREGTSPEEFARTAVEVWSQFSIEDRRYLGLVGMKMLLAKMRVYSC
ncbi:MAG: hypothetical protein KAG89_02725 [Fulvimarina manganoxydans]|uniref:hypothetical protein n=1 Tax=Fulvimarina manganoxydans TaxID=937218 RepID=UPI002353BAD5|nr:hypothetical protein [Fulvimarina manganoxydans]MCK5931060.1 hypothetical protein [Fulvimarina manganoxydans]